MIEFCCVISLKSGPAVCMMPSKPEDYEVMLTIGCGSYGKCQKIKKKSDGKVNKIQIELCLHEQYGIVVMYFYIRSLNQNPKIKNVFIVHIR